MPGRTPGTPRVDSAAQQQLGARLRAAYDDLVSEPVPEHLADLVRRLETASRAETPSASQRRDRR